MATRLDAAVQAAGEGGDLLTKVDVLRLTAARQLDPRRQAEMGQFFTPAPVARLMSSMFSKGWGRSVRLLDPGAGVGSLSAAFVARVCDSKRPPRELQVIAYEVDSTLVDYLKETLKACEGVCRRVGIKFSGVVHQEDFIEAGVSMMTNRLFGAAATEAGSFDCAILNPPYRKINTDSRERWLLRKIGVETSNLYSGFLSVVLNLLRPRGEFVAITPRSFCNGPYFKPFRKMLLESAALRRIHVFESRSKAFQDDNVLQENLIFHAVRGGELQRQVAVSSSEGPEDAFPTVRHVDNRELVHPGDNDFFIRIVSDELGSRVAERVATFDRPLSALGLSVSTGRVVDFRASAYLRPHPQRHSAPLIYPGHFDGGGFVEWPKPGKKPNALAEVPETDCLLVPGDVYVLVKRFSSKEERRRIVAAVYDPARIPGERVGFENHLNYYHCGGRGLPMTLAKGLCAYLNSTLLDSFFRQFSGHTQVNATDLRSLRYPSRHALERLGYRIGDSFPGQEDLDHLVEEELVEMPTNSKSADPIRAKTRIEEALVILKELGLPREQQNERSALTLLALLDVKPATPWAQATTPLRGITEMMDFFAEHYGKKYKPNTRETVRRNTVHQFVQAGFVIQNPDKPSRATNSPKTVYRVEPTLLALARSHGTEPFAGTLKDFLRSTGTLKAKYAGERKMRQLPVKMAGDKTIELSPGGQNVLLKEIIETFCPRFTPGGTVVYVGDASKKWAHFDEPLLTHGLGVSVEEHGKMPDVVVWHEERGWLVLIEAVTSHGPVNPKRREELRHLFRDSEVGLVFVTAFLDRKTLLKYLGDIAWQTEVWIAESPSHLIHFNGERFLGPYDEIKREQ